MSDEPETEAAPSDAAPSDAAPSDAAPTASTTTATKTKKKKRKGGYRDEPVVLAGEGTPEGALLRDANVAFEAGNYARVRELTDTLAKASDAKIVDAAAELRRRGSVDPVQIGFLVACLLALLTITYVYILS